MVLCQTRDRQDLIPIFNEAEVLLGEMLPQRTDGGRTTSRSPRQPLDWPSGCLHLLSLLQDGFAGRLGDLPAQSVKRQEKC